MTESRCFLLNGFTADKMPRVLKVYALPLQEYIQNKHILPATPRLITTYSRPTTQGIIHALSIYNSVVVATLVHWSQTGPLNPSFSLLFLNLVTGVTRVVDHPLPEVNSDPPLITSSSDHKLSEH